ncbi:hypothetical protein ACFL5H_03500 [Candidatus Latescibacterota bacterium]
MRKSKVNRTAGRPLMNWYGAIIIGTLLMLLFVSEQVCIVSLEQHIFDLTREIDAIESEADHLGIEVSNLRRVSRIQHIATEYLGLQMPEGVPETLF